ncbi:MAG: BamA/TamA family outer membrane protein, partial [Planctomycetaceae bacterium]|nr:BamA/TamA family outer membrane protein [Planctomycetaceae bacterium]
MEDAIVRLFRDPKTISSSADRFTRKLGQEVMSVRSGPDGRFLFDEAPEGEALLVAEAPTSGEAFALLTLPASKEVSMSLQPGAAIFGVLLDGLGNGVRRAQVTLRLRDRPPLAILRAKTDDRGRFGFFNLESGVYELSASFLFFSTVLNDVTPSVEPVTITLDINEGPEVYVERINISGNVRSQDKILRREIPFVEGDLFTLQKLQRARQRLVNLGYFETVNVTTQPGADRTRIIVNVEVTERPTGLFSIGGGFSSVDAFVGTIDLSQRNFLGRGWELTLRLRLGANVQQGIVSFTEPWLFDRPLSAGFDLFRTQRVFDEYDYATTGGNLRLSRPFAEYWRWNTAYRLTYDEISDVDDDADDELKDEEGSTITSAISGSLTRDTRDNVFAPSKGSLFTIRSDFAGLGGDARFVKMIASMGQFYPIWFGHILGARAEAGWATGWGGEDVPIFERFFL